jgi:hypothetical protein
MQSLKDFSCPGDGKITDEISHVKPFLFTGKSRSLNLTGVAQDFSFGFFSPCPSVWDKSSS